MGGGPKPFSGDSIAQLMEGWQQLNLVEDCEITLEANPGTTDSAKFKSFRRAGINRLSLGVQSLTPRHTFRPWVVFIRVTILAVSRAGGRFH